MAEKYEGDVDDGVNNRHDSVVLAAAGAAFAPVHEAEVDAEAELGVKEEVEQENVAEPEVDSEADARERDVPIDPDLDNVKDDLRSQASSDEVSPCMS